MTVEEIKREFRKGIKASSEAAKHMTQEQIIRQALENSHKAHKDTSTVSCFTPRKAA